MLSIVIPAYNEENGLPLVLPLIDQYLELEGITYEVIVVNDGSTDRTAEIAMQYGVNKVINHPTNIGYGNALKSGILEASYPHVCITDADGTYPIEKIPVMLKQYKKGFDMVVGARTGYHYKESLLKNPTRILFNLLAEYVAGKKIPDVNSGLRIFNREKILPFLNDLCGTFSFTTSMTLICFRQSYFVCYMPIPYYKREGRSKVKIVRDTMRAAQILVQTILTYNPLKLFLLISILCLYLSVMFLFLYMVLFHYWELFALFLACVVLALHSLLIGFLAFTSNRRIRDVQHLWDTSAE